MVTEHTIPKLAQHIAQSGEGHSGTRLTHPARDWFIGLVGTAVLFLAAGAGAGYLFWTTNNRATEAYDVAIDPVRYDPKLIERVLADYRARKVRYESSSGDVIFVPATPVPVAKDAPVRVE